MNADSHLVVLRAQCTHFPSPRPENDELRRLHGIEGEAGGNETEMINSTSVAAHAAPGGVFPADILLSRDNLLFARE